MTNTGDGFDPNIPYGVNLMDIGVEESDEPLEFEVWLKEEGMSALDWGAEDYYKEYLEQFN